MSEKIQQLLSNLATIIKDFESVQGLELDTQKAERAILDEIFNRLEKIMPFIHESIQISYWTAYGKRDECSYHDKNGICLSNKFERENTGAYPHTDNYWEYGGNQIWLTDDLEIINVIRTGSGSAWQNDSSSWKAKIEVINLEQLQTLCEFEEIIHGLIKTFEEAVKTNENKRNILQSRQKLLQTIESLLSIGVTPEMKKMSEIKKAKIIEIEIDQAALGNTWHAGKAELKQVAELYEEELKKQFPQYEFNVIPVTDSWNGAKVMDNLEIDTGAAWERTLERTPSEWWNE